MNSISGFVNAVSSKDTHSFSKENFEDKYRAFETAKDFICSMKLHPRQGKSYKPVQRGIMLSFSAKTQLAQINR